MTSNGAVLAAVNLLIGDPGARMTHLGTQGIASTAARDCADAVARDTAAANATCLTPIAGMCGRPAVPAITDLTIATARVNLAPVRP